MKVPDYLKGDLLDHLHWSDLRGVAPHELGLLVNMATSKGYNLEVLEAFQFWKIYSHKMDAGMLSITWDNLEAYTNTIKTWLTENQ